MHPSVEARPRATGPSFHPVPGIFYTSEPQAAPRAVELFEVQTRADFRLRWQALPMTSRPPLYLVFMVTEGEGLHRIGSETLYVRANMLCFLGPAALSAWQPSAAAQQGYFCTFTEEFFNADRIDKTLLRSLPFFAAPGAFGALPLQPEAARYFLDLLGHIAADARTEQPDAAPLLRTQLSLLLLRAATLYREGLPMGQAHSAGQRLTNAFLAMLDEDLAPLSAGKPVRQFSVRAYAERLHVSQNHLNDTVRRQTGRSAGTLAHDALARAATELLGHAGQPVHEVARLLGFASPTYFARFYRRRVGHSPSQARRQNGPDPAGPDDLSGSRPH